MDAEPRDAANTALLLDQEIEKRILLGICALLSRRENVPSLIEYLGKGINRDLRQHQEFIRSTLIELICTTIKDYSNTHVVQDAIASAVSDALYLNPDGPLSMAIRNVIKDSL